MTALPSSASFTDSGVTEGEFKTAITNQRDFLAGLIGENGTVITALQTLGSLGADTVTKSANYTVATTDRGKIILCTGTFTLSLTAATTLAKGFSFVVINIGSGLVTIDPSSSETIDGTSTKEIDAGSWAIITCNGSTFYSMGAVPTTGALIGFQVFTASGTYTKSTNDPSYVIVEVVGGGGTSGGTSTKASGGTSSFGSLCSATGGAAGSASSAGGSGGVGVSGDLNASGITGGNGGGGTEPSGGQSKFGGNYGLGGTGGTYGTKPILEAGAGGGGGYVLKKILASALASTETVTVGAGGVANITAKNGKSGIVMVWEYK